MLGALREAYLTAFALLGAPGLALGLLFGVLGQGGRPSKLEIGALLGLALALALLAALLAARGRTRESTPIAGAVRASLQLASAPAVPFLLGCAMLGTPAALALFWVLALLLGLLGWLILPGWARVGELKR